jgi:hypothetical protein
MMDKKIIKHATDPRRKFCDAYMYFRFMDDDDEASVLAPSNAGNGNGTYFSYPCCLFIFSFFLLKGVHLGAGGCKFSFSPHTAHNSYVLDIALAEEVETSYLPCHFSLYF